MPEVGNLEWLETTIKNPVRTQCFVWEDGSALSGAAAGGRQ